MQQFDFGQNWSDFSATALTTERVAQARLEFAQLIRHAGVELKNKSFLDIGFGQGLSLLAATELGARSVGCDINPKCGEVLARNRAWFSDLSDRPIPAVIGSILERNTVEGLRQLSPGGNGFDVVHSWGVLHHTGDMWKAIAHAAELVAPTGVLVLALYNRHWSSPLWVPIKRGYCSAPPWLKRVMIGTFYPVILVAKALATGRNPFTMERGMNFYYNVIDWVGGHPYEYASLQEVGERMQNHGFTLLWQTAARVPTGCNEQIFLRSPNGRAGA